MINKVKLLQLKISILLLGGHNPILVKPAFRGNGWKTIREVARR